MVGTERIQREREEMKTVIRNRTERRRGRS